MEKTSRELPAASPDFLGAGWWDPIEVGIRGRVREFIEELVDAELNDALGRSRYQRPGDSACGTAGYRHGRRERQLLGSFGPVTFSVPRARLANADGTSQEWRSRVLPRYARMTKQVEALIAGVYLSAPGSPGSGSAVQGRGVEGHGEPNLAESAGRLAGVVSPLPGGRGHRPADP